MATDASGAVTMIVKAKKGRMVYSNGAPIPEDQFVELPLSPNLVQAVVYGDLEEMEKPAEEAPTTTQDTEDSEDSALSA